ncbi:MAG: NAD-dependent epimerase/dehydratase family protein, partial [Spirochaetota bacterium]
MRVLLTGGTGNVGGAAVDRLVADGHEVTVIGRRAGLEVPGAAYLQADINDFDRLVSVMRGFDAIVHLAAHGSPFGQPGREVFRVNDLGTFNVYEAAAECGITRVVSAS